VNDESSDEDEDKLATLARLVWKTPEVEFTSITVNTERELFALTMTGVIALKADAANVATVTRLTA